MTEPCNSEELAQAIIHLLDHQALCQQFITMGLQKVYNYAWPQVTQRIIEHYFQLLQERDTHSHFVISSSSTMSSGSLVPGSVDAPGSNEGVNGSVQRTKRE